METVSLGADFVAQEVRRVPLCASIGVFDGVHKGHRAVISSLLSRAAADSLCPCVVTFDRNPKDSFYENGESQIFANSEKYAILSELGVKLLVELRFDDAMKSMSGEEFFKKLLGVLDIRCLVEGRDFSCGRKGAAISVEDIGPLFGIETVVVPDVERDGKRVSSTEIRRGIQKSDLNRFAETT